MAITKLQPFNLDTTANYTFANITTTNANLGNAATANFFVGDGSLLTGITVSAGNTIVNGNSNVTVSANGNVTTSVAGNSSIFTVTGTGVNVSGTLNSTGNANVANLGATGIYATTLAGSLTTASQPNITSIGTLSSLGVTGNITSGNANLGNAVTANYFIGNLYGTANTATSATTAGTVTTAAQPNITSVGTLTDLTVANTVTVGQAAYGAIAVANTTGFSTTWSTAQQAAAWTISFWVYIPTQSINYPRSLFYNGDGGAGRPVHVFLGWNGTTTYSLQLENRSGGPGSNFTKTLSGAVSQNAWHFVTVSYNGTDTVYLGLDGDVSSVSGSAISSAYAGLAFGKGTGGSTGFVNTYGPQTYTDVELTLGTASYTSNFTPPTTHPTTAGKTLLLLAKTAGTYITNEVTGSNVSVNGSPTFDSSNPIAPTGTLTVAVNSNLGNAATANYFIGSGANLTNIPAGNISGQVGNALIASTVYTNAQPNITSVGTLTGLTSTGTANLTGASNVALGPVANVHITGGSSGQYLQTDGSGTLTWATVSSGSTSNISNGNSNVNIPAANGNVNISAVGNANVLVITGTGANITGTANITGNLTAGNITTGAGSGGNISGANVISANILNASDSANLGNSVVANYFTGNFYGTANLATYATTANAVAGANVSGQVANALVAGTVYTAAQPNITSVGTLTGLTSNGVVNFANTSNTTLGAVGNVRITGGSNGQYLQTDGSGTLTWATVSSGSTSNISNGNSNVNIPAANSNVNISAVGNANIVVVTGTGMVVTGTANVSGNLTAGNITTGGGTGGNISGANVISANILNASDSANLGNSVVANYFIGSGANLTSIPAGNISGQVANALIAGTVYTNAQPNITSVGTLSSLSVTGNITSGNANLGNNVSANFFTGNGSLLTGITVSAGNTIVNGNSNVIVTANGNVTTSVAGNANILIVTGTGVNVAGTLNATGNTTVGNLFSSGSGGNISNVNVISANTFIASGNITAGNIITSGSGGNVSNVNVISANTFLASNTITTPQLISNVSTGTAPFVVTSTTQVANLSVATAGTATTAGSATTAGTVTTAAQPNITSVGTLANLTVSGTSNLGPVGNVTITGGSSGQYLQTNGSGVLTWSTVATGSTSNISNGNSNVNIPSANGNVNISAVGNANILIVTGTGVNVTGTLNATGNTTVGNLFSSGSGGNISNVNVISANTFIASGNITAGNIITSGSGGNVSNVNVISANTFIASGNITAGNANLGNNVSANFFTGNLYGTANTATSATTAGTVTTAAQPNITSVGTLTSLVVSGTGSFGGNVNLNSFNITSLATPVASTDAATKQYVDDVAQGLNVHDAAAAATPDTLANVTSGTITYNNGSSGVGANLTTTGSFNLIDGVNVQTSGTRILVKNEANAVYNGIYTWSNSTVITRATDYNSVPEVEAGDFVFVTGGTLYDNTGWVQTSTVSAIGTAGNNIEFTQFSGAGTYQAGTGLTLTGSTFSVNANQSQVTNVGTLGNLSVTGNATVGNLITSGSGGNLTNINVVSANTFTASGNITAGNASLGNAVTANYFTGNFYGTANLATFASTANAVAGANVSGQVANALIAGTVYTNAQPNITSVGTLTGLTSTGTVDLTGASNVALGPVANVHITGGSSGQYLQTDGSGTLTWSTVSVSSASISNGNSNVNIPSANGNVNISAVGTANVLVVTGTGANITGTLNVTGNATVGNLITSGSGGNLTSINVVSANTFTASGNITAGNASLGNAVTANYFTGNFYGTANVATIAGTVTTNAQPNITSVGSLTGLIVSNSSGVIDFSNTANVTLGAVGNLHISGGTTGYVLSTDGSGTLSWVAQSGGGSSASISNGTSNVNISASGGNVTTSVGGTANVIVATSTGVNVAGTLNTGTGNANVGNLGATAVVATTLEGSLTTAAQPNITSVGTLTSLGVNGTVTAVAFTANTGVFTGNGNGLSSIVGANVTGTVANATHSSTANTVTTAAQPNITSTGTLTALTVGPNSSITLSGTTGFLKANSIQGTDGTAALYPGYNAVSGAVGVRTNLTVGAGGSGNLIANAGSAIFGDASTVVITGGTTGQVLSTDGAGNLSWATASSGGGASISNGTSNVNIATSGGNVTTSVGGTSNVLVVTSTGANVAGTLNVTGNAIVGNLTATTLIGILANGNSNISIPAANGNVTISAAGTPNELVITSTGVNVAGTLQVSGQSNLGPVGNVVITGGSANQFLQTNGSGVLTWANASGGGGGITITDDTTTNSNAYYPILATITSGSLSTANVSAADLYFNPLSGQLNAIIFNSLSDRNKKSNIELITNALSKVLTLNGVTFNLIDSNESSAGLIAQDVEKVLPSAVKQNNGILSLNYSGVIGLLVESTKEQQMQIENLKQLVKEQQLQINELKNLINRQV